MGAAFSGSETSSKDTIPPITTEHFITMLTRSFEYLHHYLMTAKNMSFVELAQQLPLDQVRRVRDNDEVQFMCAIRSISQLISNRSIASLNEADKSNRLVMVKNACLLLTHLIPIVYERQNLRNVLWSSLTVSEAIVVPESEVQHHHHNHHHHHNQQTKPQLHFGEHTAAEQLLHSLLNDMFTDGICVVANPQIKSDDQKDLNEIDPCANLWANGVGGESKIGQVNDVIIRNRNVHLSLILVLLCCDQRWLDLLTDPQMSTDLSIATFTSILNTALSEIPAQVAHLPESNELVRLAFDLLIVTLTHKLNNTKSNQFIEYASRIHMKEDLEVISRSVSRLMRPPAQPSSLSWIQSWLGDSGINNDFRHETLFTLYQLVRTNPLFLGHLLTSPILSDLITNSLTLMLESNAIAVFVAAGSTDRQTFAAIHISALMLLTMSTQRNFGVRLNKCVSQAHQTQIRENAANQSKHANAFMFNDRICNYADILIACVSSIICRSPVNWKPYVTPAKYALALIATIANVSPFLKSINLQSSHRLLHMLDVFTTRSNLLKSECHCEIAGLLVGTINNLIQFQFDGNSALVYLLVRRKILFDRQCRNIVKMSETTFGNEIANAKSANQIIRGDHHHQIQLSNQIHFVLQQRRTDDGCDQHNNGAGDLNTNNNPSVVSTRDQVPSFVWFNKWRSDRFRCEVIMRLLEIIVPQIEAMCIDNQLNNQEKVIEFIKEGTAVGLLPIPTYRQPLQYAFVDDQALVNYAWNLVEQPRNSKM